MIGKFSRGFTLIELLIAVAIVAILARLAVPSYRNYVIRANRADAQQTLLRAAQGMERYAITNGANGYSGASLGSLAVTNSVTQSPSSGTAIYTIAFSGTPTITAFVIKATPVATRINKNDDYLSIDNAGTRKWGATKTWTSR